MIATAKRSIDVPGTAKRPFRWRAPRLDLVFPVVFRGEDVRVRGVCRNFSESGLLATFAPALALACEGELRLAAGPLCHAQRARVVRRCGEEHGFAFLFQHEMEREAIRQLLLIARQTPWLVGAVPCRDPLPAVPTGARTGTLPP